jgi:hypothetical protein
VTDYARTGSRETYTVSYQIIGDAGPVDRITHIVEVFYLRYNRLDNNWRWEFESALLHGRDHRPNGTKGNLLINTVTDDYLAEHHPDIHKTAIEVLTSLNGPGW